jgi:hypothetical protein
MALLGAVAGWASGKWALLGPPLLVAIGLAYESTHPMDGSAAAALGRALWLVLMGAVLLAGELGASFGVLLRSWHRHAAPRSAGARRRA